LSKIASKRTFGIVIEEVVDDERELGLVDDRYRGASYVDERRLEGKECVEALGHVNRKRHGDARKKWDRQNILAFASFFSSVRSSHRYRNL
jgi:hypothetical protein